MPSSPRFYNTGKYKEPIIISFLKSGNDFSPELQVAVAAAQRAGDYITNNLDRFDSVEFKEDKKGLVTEYDRQVERMIREELSRFGTFPVLGEEYGHDEQDTGQPQNNEYLWCIDPIDGTTNFYHRFPFYAISIALLHNMTSQVGVVYQPLGQKLYYAELGKGAFLNGTPISVSGKSNPAEAILLINHGYKQSDMERCVAVTQRLEPQFETRKFGATALELAWLAQGLADAFLCSGDELWDYAAGMLLIREAGGQVTDWRGHHFNGESSYMCASNGIFHSQLVDAVHDLQP